MNPDPMELKANKPILACVSFCRESEMALLTATRLAASSGAPLVVLHVVHEPGNRPGLYRRNGASDATLPIEEIAERMLTEFLSDVRARHPGSEAALDRAKTRLAPGIPGTRIPEVAEQIGAQLIVIGSNGRGTLARLLHGSISDGVARNAAVPVTVVHAHPEAWELSAALYEYERPTGSLAAR
jgi:nucleotide-binding universal stress UspA family protein